MYCNDHTDSEDLFQEILLQLWKSYPSFKGDSKVSTWIYRVALNTAITRLQKRKRQVDNWPLSFKENNIPVSGNDRIDLEFSEELQKAIDSLNKFEKALMMLYLDEKSYSEIAEIMGLTESNVGVKINRIKNKLKTILNP